LEEGQLVEYANKIVVFRTESDTQMLSEDPTPSNPNGRIAGLFGKKVSATYSFDCCTRLFGQA